MKIWGKILLPIIFLFTLCAASVSGAQPSTLKPTGYVNDFAGIINPEAKSQLEQLLSAYERSTTNEIAVATVSSLDGVPIEDYATRLFEQWGIGKKGKDNGLLILVAPTERKSRIEVGYGLEGAINDAMAGRIMDNVMIPLFRQGDYSTGILNTAAESIRIINEKYGLEFDPSAAGVGAIAVKRVKPKKTSIFGIIFRIAAVLFIIFIFIKNPTAGLFLLLGMSAGGRGSGGFRGSSFGGGSFGGFGGGLSGGGGASRGW